jgi:nucleoid DNA-binding protein
MIKQDIVNRVAEKTGITKIKSEIAVDMFVNALKSALLRSERIEIRGFGVLVVKARRYGIGRNPRSGEIAIIKPGLAVKFKPGKELK